MRIEIEITRIVNGWTVYFEDMDNHKDKGKIYFAPTFDEITEQLLELFEGLEADP